MDFDMDKAIKECEAACGDRGRVVYALGAGRIAPVLSPKKRKAQKEAVNYIGKLDGFAGVHCVDKWHTLLLFDTLNHAKAARNLLKDKMPVGRVCPTVVDRHYFDKALELMESKRHGNKEEGV